MDKAKKVGIFGGTFNPPHIGHYLLAKDVKKQFNLDKIFFVPSYLPPHKDHAGIIDSGHREKMTQLLISGDPDFMISEYEIKKQGISYSINTVKYFMTEFPGKEFYFITGSDAFYFIETWKEYKELIKLIKFIIFERADFSKEKVVKKHPFAAQMLWAKTHLIDLSASELRARIRFGANIQEEVGGAVWEYIDKNKLYRQEA